MGTSSSRRRERLGPAASAALPALWKAIARRDWSHADFARFIGRTTAMATRLLYGDCGAGRKTASRCAELGVRLVLWDKPCPPNWKPHSYESLRPKKKVERASSPFPVLGATGTDD